MDGDCHVETIERRAVIAAALGPNYEDLFGRLKRAARNVFRAQGEIVTDIEITTIESGEAAIALWVVPGVKTGSMGAPLNASL